MGTCSRSPRSPRSKTTDVQISHHRNETLLGSGDPWDSGRADLEYQHIQFGTGTFDPIVAVEG